MRISPRPSFGSFCLTLCLTHLAFTCRAEPSPYRTHYADGLITGAAWVGGALVSLLPVDLDQLWKREPLTFDERVRSYFSPAAATASDVLLFTTSMLPVAAAVIAHPDRALGAAALIYTEALGVTYLLTAATKQLVRRPRPYVYRSEPAILAYRRAQGINAQLSFFSGHASLAFSAAVTGAYLFALRERAVAARAALWGTQLAFAAAVANLRVRAGRHYYSDVAVGALIGATVGVVSPLVHAREAGSYSPHAAEWIAMGTGLVLGVLASEMMPFRAYPQMLRAASRFRLAPIVSPGVELGMALTWPI